MCIDRRSAYFPSGVFMDHPQTDTDLYFPFELIFKALEYLQSYDSEEKSLTSHPFLFCHTHCDLISYQCDDADNKHLRKITKVNPSFLIKLLNCLWSVPNLPSISSVLCPSSTCLSVNLHSSSSYLS